MYARLGSTACERARRPPLVAPSGRTTRRPRTTSTTCAPSRARFRDVLADCDPAARVPAVPTGTPPTCSGTSPRCSGSGATDADSRPDAPDEDADAAPARRSYDDLLRAFDDWSAGLVAALDGGRPGRAGVELVGRPHRRVHPPPAGARGAGAPPRRRAGRRPGQPLDPRARGRRRARVPRRDVRRMPPWGDVRRRCPHSVRVDVTDTAESVWLRVRDVHGHRPRAAGRATTRTTSTSCRATRGVEPDAVVDGPAAALDLGCGAAATTPTSDRRDRRRARPVPRRGVTRSTDAWPARGPCSLRARPVSWLDVSAATGGQRAGRRRCARRPARRRRRGRRSVSPSLSVRSGARKRRAKASDFLPAPTWSPV